MEYDIFISYASEDKDEIVQPLAEELDKYLKVWYDDYVIRLGDDIRGTIFRGLSNSRFGIVIFSPSFFKKKKRWTKYELDLLLSIESEKGKVNDNSTNRLLNDKDGKSKQSKQNQENNTNKDRSEK